MNLSHFCSCVYAVGKVKIKILKTLQMGNITHAKARTPLQQVEKNLTCILFLVMVVKL